MIWTIARNTFRSLGAVSDGVRTGVEFGFSSGEMLDYVYDNRARGRGSVGRLIDRMYLNSTGWCGIRERRSNLVRTLTALVLARRANGLHTRILDIAAGPGRYLLDVAADLGGDDLCIECRDADADAVTLGRQQAAERGLHNVIYARHDALDAEAPASIRPKPDIVVASGLYEILTDEAAIRRSLRGLAQLLGPDGVLVLTGQPQHPQLELIARLLTHRDGSPWRMHLRSTETLETWCREAGFADIHTLGDTRGIFTISLMRTAA
ncbi:MAG: class I SAM-dependent methyltransferase family protein [Chloroflexi bacterium]|nr:class I SAM-dependent methyltransferase family protein [Chloroflexota bacterium]MBV9133408.1 class I SAM-dependent methyltransferase family protein [Chloroflexota bacterium]MBV9894011.1 class I SAM-dependent methyltransferase family protein [Chloroflexota bacterium]